MSEYQRLCVKKIVSESDGAKSFYLVPENEQPTVSYRPGQHLQFRVQPPGRSRPVARFYTISDCENDQHYRVTIKKELPPVGQTQVPPGEVSSYFHEHLAVGDRVEAKPPAGDFYLDLDQDHPVVLIAGGIGVTPLLSMVNAIATHQPDREAYFFFALRHGGDHVFKTHLQQLAAEHSNIRLHVSYDQPRHEDQLNADYDRAGRIDLALLAEHLPSLDMPYYICGPGPMMDALVKMLLEAGIANQQIHTESFGPASKAYKEISPEPAEVGDQADTAIVHFARSGKRIPWDTGYESLLQFSEDQGVAIEAGCLYGDCATCMTGLIEGQVKYNHPTVVTPDPDACLPCSCRPQGSITLDA